MTRNITEINVTEKNDEKLKFQGCGFKSVENSDVLAKYTTFVVRKYATGVQNQWASVVLS